MIIEITWDVIASAGLTRAVWLLGEAIKDRRSLGANANGRRSLADWQVEHAAMGVLIYALLLVPGIMALIYQLGMTSLEQRLFIVPFFLVFAVLVLMIRQERDAYYRLKQLRRVPPERPGREHRKPD